MSNVDSSSTIENPRSLRNIFLDLKSDLGLTSESSFKVKKRFGEYIGSSSEFSGNSNSNFDDELSLMLKNTNKHGNLLDILNKKYLIGYAISEAFSGTDLDAYTLFHIWNTKRTSQKSFVLVDHPNYGSDDNFDYIRNPDFNYKNVFVIFHQQLYYSSQSKLQEIDRTRPIFKIPPQDHSLVHAIEPKTTSLVLLAYIYGLKNVKFLGLKNHSSHARVPGPYLSLFSMESKTDYMTCMNWIQNLVFNSDSNANFANIGQNTNYSNFDGYLNISYFLYELDMIYSYILLQDNCYYEYTEPILMKSFTGWTFGKLSLFFYSYRIRSYYKNISLSEMLSRLDVILSLICKIFSEFKGSSRQLPLDKYSIDSFNFYCFVSIVYSYLYAILSIPLGLLPWENYVLDKAVPVSPANTEPNSNPLKHSEDADATNSSLYRTNSIATDISNYEDSDSNEDSRDKYNFINMSVHNEFAETAADSTCVENTRRHDNLMTYVIGIVTGEGNWIKKKEKFVDVIDTYKLGLSWYRRPSFSNTLYNTSYKAWPIALYYYNLLIEPCGRAFFVWYWKNIEAWSSSNIWSYRVKMATGKKSFFSQFSKKLVKKGHFSLDSNLQLKRQVSLRLRDTLSFIFDMELELKRALLYS